MAKLGPAFISFEGGEGSGKSSLIRFFCDKLKQDYSIDPIVTFEPGGTSLGEKIREILISPQTGNISYTAEAMLYAAARAEHVEKVILPALDQGKIILCDRFVMASLVYQGFARGLGFEKVQKINSEAIHGCQPLKTFLLDIDPEIGLQRVKKRQNGQLDRIEAEGLAFHRKIRESYLSLAQQKPEDFCILDASKSQSTVREQAWAELKSILGLA